MVRHAQAKEDKEARRDDILGAALALFLQDTRRLPSAAAIARKAGLAKGTVYLYFETKEQIFAALLAREWENLLSSVEGSFAETAEDPDAVVRLFIDRFVSFLDGTPHFLRLDSFGYGHLETNLSPDEFWRFKNAFSAALDHAGRRVDGCLALPAGHGLRLLVTSYALTKGLWQTLDLPDWLREDERVGQHPLAKATFDVELRTALAEYWRGALDGASRIGAGRSADP